MKKLKQLETLLRKNKYKITPARIAILGAFSQSSGPINAEEINKKIKNGVDLVTIYRTLNSFEKSGILRKVVLGGDSAHFELNLDHHHHIICTNCKKIDEFEAGDDKKLIAKVLKQVKNFKSVSGHTFDLFGLCKTCEILI